jgi:putative nucleotidyltransferase with HDIG domain
MGVGEIGEDRDRLPLGGVPSRLSWRARWPGILFGVLFAVLATLILVVRVAPADRVTLQPDDVSMADIRAPFARSYISDVLSEEARRRAEIAVPDVYDEPQTSIRNRQVARSREVLDYISSVRADGYASAEEEVAWIRAIPDISLSVQAIGQILNLSDEAWLRVTGEVPVVVNRAMREEIRENQLAAARARVESLIGLQIELSDQELEVVTVLARALLQPNTFYNAEKTEAARQKAREAVEPVVVSFAAGEIIVRAGDIVKAVDVEALEELGLSQAAWDWWQAAGTALFVLILTALIWTYLFLFAPWFWEHPHWPPLLVVTTVSFVLLARLMVPQHAVLPYFFPLAALAMLLGALSDLRLALVVTLAFGLLVGHLTGGAAEITTYAVAGALAGAYSLGRGERFASFARAGGFVVLSNVLVLLAFRVPEYRSLDVTGILQLGGAALANGMLGASITLLAFFILGSVFGVTTSLQLIELSRLTHPLLKLLIEEAPGTYYHSAMISNLAERAASAIGADGALARVGAFYHDVGKIRRPPFFVENQAEGINPYDRLDPYTSAQIVMSHVKDGLALALEYRLPAQIRAFIPEHHGTRLVSFFHNKALKEADGETAVREEDYRYPGPKPQSRETAIVMLADGCEAAVRANRPASVEELEETVRQIISQQLLDGQLDESNLTLRDLDRIRQSFVEVLRGVHHPRIRYPEPPKAIAAGTQENGARQPG